MRVTACLAALLALVLSATPAAAQGIGGLPYMRDVLDALSREFDRTGMETTGDFRMRSGAGDVDYEATLRVDRSGRIAIGCDRDCYGVSIALVEDGREIGMTYGEQAASLYVHAGVHTVRLRMTDCAETFCYYGVMVAY